MCCTKTLLNSSPTPSRMDANQSRPTQNICLKATAARLASTVQSGLVEVRPDQELPVDFCVSLRRILVPIAFDKASAVALNYGSALAGRFGSELAVLYAFEGSDYAQSSNIEAELRAFCSAPRLLHLEFRVFLKPGPTGEQVKAVAKALDADLVVISSDYQRRFLSYLTHQGTGILRVPGLPCRVVVVNAVVMEPFGRKGKT